MCRDIECHACTSQAVQLGKCVILISACKHVNSLCQPVAVCCSNALRSEAFEALQSCQSDDAHIPTNIRYWLHYKLTLLSRPRLVHLRWAQHDTYTHRKRYGLNLATLHKLQRSPKQNKKVASQPAENRSKISWSSVHKLVTDHVCKSETLVALISYAVKDSICLAEVLLFSVAAFGHNAPAQPQHHASRQHSAGPFRSVALKMQPRNLMPSKISQSGLLLIQAMVNASTWLLTLSLCTYGKGSSDQGTGRLLQTK